MTVTEGRPEAHQVRMHTQRQVDELWRDLEQWVFVAGSLRSLSTYANPLVRETLIAGARDQQAIVSNRLFELMGFTPTPMQPVPNAPEEDEEETDEDEEEDSDFFASDDENSGEEEWSSPWRFSIDPNTRDEPLFA